MFLRAKQEAEFRQPPPPQLETSTIEELMHKYPRFVLTKFHSNRQLAALSRGSQS